MQIDLAGVLFLFGTLGVISWFLLRLLFELTTRDIQRELNKAREKAMSL